MCLLQHIYKIIFLFKSAGNPVNLNHLSISSNLSLQVNRTSELARVFGIDFFSVLSRGSQYRVESMFLRLAHTQNYVAISPGNNQVLNQ